VLLIGTIVLSGCSTVPKKVKEEVQTLQGRVDTLESRVEGVEGRQAELEKAASDQSQDLEEIKLKAQRVRLNMSPKAKSGVPRTETMEIQTCLKSAGFYHGAIDGVKGRATKKAIRAFQKANGLRADGVVGPKTWELLNKYKR
jgi:peptidoglycan hydrolase-like protein with peptidoglycan-binding domain